MQDILSSWSPRITIIVLSEKNIKDRCISIYRTSPEAVNVSCTKVITSPDETTSLEELGFISIIDMNSPESGFNHSTRSRSRANKEASIAATRSVRSDDRDLEILTQLKIKGGPIEDCLCHQIDWIYELRSLTPRISRCGLDVGLSFLQYDFRPNRNEIPDTINMVVAYESSIRPASTSSTQVRAMTPSRSSH